MATASPPPTFCVSSSPLFASPSLPACVSSSSSCFLALADLLPFSGPGFPSPFPGSYSLPVVGSYSLPVGLAPPSSLWGWLLLPPCGVASSSLPVVWPPLPSCGVASSSLPSWLGQMWELMSQFLHGARFRWRPPSPQSFDDVFFGGVSHRFHVIDSQPVVPGFFDAPFTPSELRRALHRRTAVLCVQNEPPLVAIRSPPLLQSRPLREFSPLPRSAAPWFLSSCVGTRPCPPVAPCFKIFEHLVHARIGPTFLPNLTNVRGFRWACGLSGWVSCRPSSSHTFVAFVDTHKAFDTS